MVDEHGRIERRRHVPDVLEREKRHVAPGPADTPAGAAPTVADVTPDVLGPVTAPDHGYWGGLDSRHRLWLAGGIAGAALLVVAIGIGLYFALRPVEPSSPKDAESPITVPSEVPSSSVAATGGLEATGSVEPTGPVAGTVPAGRAPLIAYRAGGSVWISGQHGGNARAVYNAAAGVFSLSPNGLTIAYVDPGAGTLRLIDVTTGRTKPVGPALPYRPSWAADSSFVTYTRQGAGGHFEEVARVDAGGAGSRVLLQGSRGRVMADGKTVVAVPNPTALLGQTSVVAVLSTGVRVTVAGRVAASDVCPAASGLYVADAGGAVSGDGAASTPSLRFAGWDGGGLRTLVKTPASGSRVSFSDLALSPDGRWLVYAESGDDGFSRLFALRTSGGPPVSLTPRLDGYFMNWSADGGEVFLVEGNAIQGEATRVSAIRPDGTGHRVVVEGGGL